MTGSFPTCMPGHISCDVQATPSELGRIMVTLPAPVRCTVDVGMGTQLYNCECFRLHATFPHLEMIVTPAPTFCALSDTPHSWVWPYITCI